MAISPWRALTRVSGCSSPGAFSAALDFVKCVYYVPEHFVYYVGYTAHIDPYVAYGSRTNTVLWETDAERYSLIIRLYLLLLADIELQQLTY